MQDIFTGIKYFVPIAIGLCTVLTLLGQHPLTLVLHSDACEYQVFTAPAQSFRFFEEDVLRAGLGQMEAPSKGSFAIAEHVLRMRAKAGQEWTRLEQPRKMENYKESLCPHKVNCRKKSRDW